MAGETVGKIAVHRIESTVLRGNPLADPTLRDLFVYLPPGYDPARRYPALLALTGTLSIPYLAGALAALGENHEGAGA